MLLEYLVPSKARREVWRTLHREGRALTVRELARKAGVPYSNAHHEVMRMRELGLLRVEEVGNALLCAWNAKNPTAGKLAELLDVTRSEDLSDEEHLYASLKHWGAGLVRGVRTAEPRPLEETLACGVELARRDPHVAQVWPVVFAKNRSVVDLDLLESLVRRLGQKHPLGFLLSVTGKLLRDSALQKFARRLRDPRVRRPQNFFLLDHGKRAQRIAEERTPKLARDWFLIMNFSLQTFQSHFDKFVQGP